MTARPPLTDVIIAFDIDNTLLDPTGENYEQTTRALMAEANLGAPLEEAVEVYEWVRSKGRVLEALGFANPRHVRDHPDGLALVTLLLGDGGKGPDDTGTTEGWRQAIEDLDRLQRQSQVFPPGKDALHARLELNDRCGADPALAMLRRAITQLAATDFVRAWSARYASLEAQEHVPNIRPLIDSLRARGAFPVIISEGRREIQMGKLERLGLLDMLHAQTLITEAAADVSGIVELDDAIALHLSGQMQSSSGTESDELRRLLWFRMLIRQWDTKSPAFFGRCLHALRASIHTPGQALADMTVVDESTWSSRPLKFVMIGDRYDKDAAPLIDLLGPGAGVTLRLQYGKYADRQPTESLPEARRPTRTLSSWSALEAYVTEELSAEDVAPITAPPAVLPQEATGSEYWGAGCESDLEAIRRVVTMALHHSDTTSATTPEG